ncbi:hypothetical protein ABZP36_030970 [Zizania latifolia]
MSWMLDQEMSTRLLHLACKHDAVQCARLLLEGGHGITASLVDARDQLARTSLHVAAEAHSAWCVELLLSKNAHTDLRLVDAKRPATCVEMLFYFVQEPMVHQTQSNGKKDQLVLDICVICQDKL